MSSGFSNDKHLKHNREVVGNSLIKWRREGWEKDKIGYTILGSQHSRRENKINK